MAQFDGEQDPILMTSRDRLPEGTLYVSHFFPPPDDEDGLRLTDPTPQPPMPEYKSFDGNPDTPPLGKVHEMAGQFGEFAFAAIRSTY